MASIRFALILFLCGSGFSFAADLSWMQTARVFLLDAYQYPFAPRLEFNAGEIAESMADMHFNVVRMSTMGKYCTIQGARFSVHPDQGNRDLLAEMISACKPRGIKVVPYISTGHKLAWSMVTRDHPEYAQTTTPRGAGPSRQHMYVGEDHGTICWNTPYRQAYLDLVRHVVADYEIAGIYFDTWRAGYFWQWPSVCYCGGCRKGFRKAAGLELPYHANREDYTREELAVIEKYHKWYQDELVGILQEVRRIVKSHKDIPLIYNINNPQLIAREDPRILANLDAFLYERGESMVERAEGVSLARATGMYVWPYIGTYDNWPRLVTNGLDYQQEAFTTMMFGGGSIVAQPTGFIKNKENRQIISYPFEIMEKNRDCLEGFRNEPYVGVVYAFEDPPGHARNTWFWQCNTRTATLGAFAACLREHVQVSSLLDSALDRPEALRDYKVLYLADIPFLSPRQIRNIRDFVENGGGLVVGYATSLYAADRNRLSRFGLEDLVRVQPEKPTGELARYIENYTAMVGGPNDLYLTGRGDAFEGRWRNRLVPLFFYEPVRPLSGAEVSADIVRGDGLQPMLPGVVTSRYGKGKVAYLASSLESLFVQDNTREIAEFIKSLIQGVSPEPPPYELFAPQHLIANLTSKGNRHVLHLTNWTGNKFEKNRVKEYYLAPVENVRVLLRVPEGKHLRNIDTLVPGAVRVHDLGKTVEVRLDRVEAFQGIVYTLED